MRPGDITVGYDDHGHCLCLVVATSRHKRRMDTGDAVALLAVDAVQYVRPAWEDREDYEAAVESVARLIDPAGMRWRSVTKAELDQDTHDICATQADHVPGEWCTGGQGAGWMDVLYVSTVAVEELLVAAGEQTPEGRQQ